MEDWTPEPDDETEPPKWLLPGIILTAAVVIAAAITVTIKYGLAGMFALGLGIFAIAGAVIWRLGKEVDRL